MNVEMDRYAPQSPSPTGTLQEGVAGRQNGFSRVWEDFKDHILTGVSKISQDNDNCGSEAQSPHNDSRR